jgi:hypothetical protein
LSTDLAFVTVQTGSYSNSLLNKGLSMSKRVIVNVPKKPKPQTTSMVLTKAMLLKALEALPDDAIIMFGGSSPNTACGISSEYKMLQGDEDNTPALWLWEE